MNVWSFILLTFVILALSFLAFLVIRVKKKNKQNYYFFGFIISVLLFLLFSYFENETYLGLGFNSIMLKFDFATGPLAIYFVLMFSLNFPAINKKKYLPYFLLLPVIVLIYASLFTDLLVNNVRIENETIRFDFGWLYAFDLLYTGIYFGFAIIKWIVDWIRTISQKRMQVLYVLVGFLITGVITTVMNLLLQNVLTKEVFRLSIYSTLFVISFSSYAIVKHHLMDIKLVIQKSLIYSLLLAIISGFYLALIFLVNFFTEDLPSHIIVIISGAAVVLLSFTLPFIQRAFQKWTDRIFYKEPVDYQGALKELNCVYTSVSDLKTLTRKTLEIIEKSLKVESTHFFLCSKESNVSNHVLATKFIDLQVCKSSALLKYFKDNVSSSKMILLEDLENDQQQFGIKDKHLDELISEMKKINASLCLSATGKDNFMGILCVGKKKSNEPFFINDIEWLDIVGKQFGIAIERGALYENLEQLVEQRTKQLTVANTRLREISKAKTEFVSVASHQLRTPLTVIMSIFSLLLDHDLGKMNFEQLDYVNRGLQQSQKLIKLINQLLNISRIEAGRMNLNLEKIDLNKLIHEKIDTLSTLAQKSNINVKFVQKAAQPLIKIDKSLIGEVVVNLIDNAIKYMDNGDIRVIAESDRNNITIRIVDQGSGLTTVEKSKLFKRFMTGAQKRKIFVSGTGLGLYFSRKVVEAHNGKIWAESAGKGKGSTFIFTLPYNDFKH